MKTGMTAPGAEEPRLVHGVNPLTGMDFPDPDVIRVDDAWYMISTTMHFFPGAQILRSFDLIEWEHCAYIYDRLESTPGEILEGDENIYGHGMWAASLRHHAGKFYAVFIAHEWDRTFLFTADYVEGPWKKSYIEGIYHDPSLLFDDDGRVYIAYGGRDIRLTELKEDLSGPLPGGLDRIIVRDAPGDFLGYEGSHLYKINGKYLLFLIHSRQREWFRTQACFIADSPDAVWAGGDVLYEDLDGLNSGVAQGGVVDTPDGRWFGVLFQDRGAVGRVPVLVPLTWNRFGYPVFGRVEKEISNLPTRPGRRAAPLYADDDFDGSGGGPGGLSASWQFCHEPREGLWRCGGGAYRVVTDKLSSALPAARNILTQRTMLPRCAAEVTMDAAGLGIGDCAGLCLLIGGWAFLGVTREQDGLFLVMRARRPGETEAEEQARLPLRAPSVRLRAEADLTGSRDEARFFVCRDGVRLPVGPPHLLRFTLEHFAGCRFGLFMYSTLRPGGEAAFREFRYFPPR